MNNPTDYVDALHGEGPLAGQWADKPHRLVQDLAKRVERLSEACRTVADALAIPQHWKPSMPAHLEGILRAALADATSEAKP